MGCLGAAGVCWGYSELHGIAGVAAGGDGGRWKLQGATGGFWRLMWVVAGLLGAAGATQGCKDLLGRLPGVMGVA